MQGLIGKEHDKYGRMRYHKTDMQHIEHPRNLHIELIILPKRQIHYISNDYREDKIQ